MQAIIGALEGGAVNLAAFIGDTASGSWVYVPLIYLAVLHTPTNRKAANLLQAMRPKGKPDE